MKSLLLAIAMLLMQGGYQANVDHSEEVDAAPARFHFERALELPPASHGQACAIIDDAVYAHSSGRLNDLRIYTSGDITSGDITSRDMEIPFARTESREAGQQEEAARILNLGKQGASIAFDVAMPQRPYTEVDLDLNASDFYATAHVWGEQNAAAARTDLGQFVLFDLRSRGLSRSTTLTLQESSFPLLHVEIKVTPSPGSDGRLLTPEMVRGAIVPPSREAQTLYTTVAAANVIAQTGRFSVATLHVPAHVPVERVHFVLAPDFRRDFLRTVTISARPDLADAIGSAESVEGEIERVNRPGSADGIPAIRSERLAVEALLASSLRQSATVTVSVNNGDDAPLGLRAVELQMRQRALCFDAQPGARYVLRYGSASSVRSPAYDYARLFHASPSPVRVSLGTEAPNPKFRDEVLQRSYVDRHPEVLWVALLLVIGVLGTVALHNARRVGRPQ